MAQARINGRNVPIEPGQTILQAAQSANVSIPTLCAMGITQHTTGVMNVIALANLQMLLGNLGIPGGGVNPLRGHNNVQGACDVGAAPGSSGNGQRARNNGFVVMVSLPRERAATCAVRKGFGYAR